MYFPESQTEVGKVLVTFGLTFYPSYDVQLALVEGPDGFRFAFNHLSHFDTVGWNGILRYTLDEYRRPVVALMALTGSPLRSGNYTFSIVDRNGNVIRRTTTFEDNSESFIPQVESIDYTQFSPTLGEGPTSLTPTITWDTFEKADYFYMLRVFSRDGTGRDETVFTDSIFNADSEPNKSFLDVPPGVLEPEKIYGWDVEICDSNDLKMVNNCALLPLFYMVTLP